MPRRPSPLKPPAREATRADLLDADSCDDLVFTGLDLQAHELASRELTGCTFRSCKLQETRWTNSRLEDCRFERCDLTRMQPRALRAHDLHFADCKLMGVDWSELGQFPRLSFTDCVLDFASFVGLGLRKTSFLRCKIGEANFFDCDLRDADFAGSDLRASILRGCKLAGADFSAATSLCFDPAQNDARGAVIPIESAVLMALQCGLKVAGFTAQP